MQQRQHCLGFRGRLICFNKLNRKANKQTTPEQKKEKENCLHFICPLIQCVSFFHLNEGEEPNGETAKKWILPFYLTTSNLLPS